MWYTKKLNIFSLFQTIFKDEKTSYDHFSRPSRYRSGRNRRSRGDYADPTHDLPNSFLPLMWNPILMHPRVAIHARSVIFLRLGVHFVSFSMCVVSSARRVPARKRSLLNDFQSFVALTRSRTRRLQKALCELGLKIGGQAGADVGSELGISGSRDTILRLVRQSQPSAQSEPHVIGLDDWGATRSCICSCKNSRKEDLTWGSAPSALPG